MKLLPLSLFLFLLSSPLVLRADLTIVEKIEGAGPVSEMTVKIKGDMARIDSSPKITSIMNGKTGDMVTLMNDQKVAVRMSAEKLQAAADMVKKYGDKETAAKADAAPSKPTATGKKEKINGYDTEQYTQDLPNFKATYWIAASYPGAADILKQMQSLSSSFLKKASNMPDYRDFPGLPLKTVFSTNGTEITTTIVSIKTDPVSDNEFTVPADYQEMKTPDLKDLMGGKAQMPEGQASPAKP